MIERYTNPEMGGIWDLQQKYETWFEVELAAMEGMVSIGLVPKDAFEAVKKADVSIKPERIEEIERTTKHDIIAFLTYLEEQIGDAARWIHFGMTSSDVLDTAFALQLKRASEIIMDDLLRFREVLKERAIEHRETVMVGRSHGIHAEPITFGLVLALYYEEIGRQIERFEHAAKGISVGMISGAVGTFANIPPEVEEFVCKKLGLAPEPVSNQVIQRDRHAEYFTTLGLIGATLEKISLQIRHMQRTELREAEESFSKGQKGSSAMPHKRNPIGTENISGLARLLRSNAIAAMENVALWHERDISHSSVERIIGPDSTILIDYMLKRLTRIVSNLAVFPETMLENLNLTRGLIYSQRVLLDLIDKKLPRQKAYEIVQKNAMKVWRDKSLNLKDQLLSDEELLEHLDANEIEQCFDPRYHLKHVDKIFKRVFG